MRWPFRRRDLPALEPAPVAVPPAVTVRPRPPILVSATFGLPDVAGTRSLLPRYDVRPGPDAPRGRLFGSVPVPPEPVRRAGWLTGLRDRLSRTPDVPVADQPWKLRVLERPAPPPSWAAEPPQQIAPPQPIEPPRPVEHAAPALDQDGWITNDSIAELQSILDIARDQPGPVSRPIESGNPAGQPPRRLTLAESRRLGISSSRPAQPELFPDVVIERPRAPDVAAETPEQSAGMPGPVVGLPSPSAELSGQSAGRPLQSPGLPAGLAAEISEPPAGMSGQSAEMWRSLTKMPGQPTEASGQPTEASGPPAETSVQSGETSGQSGEMVEPSIGMLGQSGGLRAPLVQQPGRSAGLPRPPAGPSAGRPELPIGRRERRADTPAARPTDIAAVPTDIAAVPTDTAAAPTHAAAAPTHTAAVPAHTAAALTHTAAAPADTAAARADMAAAPADTATALDATATPSGEIAAAPNNFTEVSAKITTAGQPPPSPGDSALFQSSLVKPQMGGSPKDCGQPAELWTGDLTESPGGFIGEAPGYVVVEKPAEDVSAGLAPGSDSVSDPPVQADLPALPEPGFVLPAKGTALGSASATVPRARRLGLGGPLPPGVRRVIDQVTEPTERPPEDLVAVVGAAHGVDVSDTRVHRGPEATTRADSMEARAFTAGGTVFLPDTAGPVTTVETRATLAHELTHVAQQRVLGTALPAEWTPAGQALESEAVLAERWVLAGASGSPLVHAPIAKTLASIASTSISDGVQRQPLTETSWTAPDEILAQLASQPEAPTPPVPIPELPDLTLDDPAEEPIPEPTEKWVVDQELVERRDRLLALCAQRPANLDNVLDMEELAVKLYHRLRGLLRGELIVDRERAGLLTDFR